VSLIWGVGKAFQDTLAKDGITRIAQLQQREKSDLMRRYGVMGARLYHLSRGEDMREVSTDDETKSVSAETTFDDDISDSETLEGILWELAQKVSRRAKSHHLGGTTVNLKLKSADFKTRTRATSLDEPTNMAHRMFEAAKPLLHKEATGTKFRLIGIGISNLNELADAPEEHSLDQRTRTLTKAESAMDLIRQKFGKDAVDKGLALKGK
jgi:DNA polymerase IV